MKIVADTSAFLAVVLDEPERDWIINQTAGQELVAPEFLPSELGNALTALFKIGRLASADLTSAWNAAQSIPVELRSIDIEAALELALKLNIYAYDAYFLECAVYSRLPLLTLDRALANNARSLSIPLVE
ncbi:MAG: type II toxin-antitoxin system VapC family toxin [Candidatus Hydrogenedentes bacterium]|nr:type II toxin-antitoxin system VapC family toxin [Candidatus Hydrogenedentota bacterium]